MIRKIFKFYLILLLILIFTSLYGSLLKHHYSGGKKHPNLQKFALTLAQIPNTAEDIINNILKGKNLDPNKPGILIKHKDKIRFKQFIPNKRNALLVLPRYDHSLNRSVIDLVDLNNFEIIHTYSHDINAMHDQITNRDEFEKVFKDDVPIRFEYRHPLLLEDGSIVSDSDYSVEFKIGFCSNLIWINDDEKFHHSKMLDHNGDIWVAGQMYPQSRYVLEYKAYDFWDDSIIKIDLNGNILFNKSVTELMIENNLIRDGNIFENGEDFRFDPIHLNDIEPALEDSKYWKKGDVFLSLRHQSSIIHYRPSDNKVINYIEGPFSQQHDVDIISDKEISIFNNNAKEFIDGNAVDGNSEVLIYDFRKNEYSSYLSESLIKNDIQTPNQGRSEILPNGDLFIEETYYSRTLYFNADGSIRWTHINRSDDGKVYPIGWSRILYTKEEIQSVKNLIENKGTCNE